MTTHPETSHTGAALAPDIGSAASAQQAIGTASVAEYSIDPARWGNAEIAALFPGFLHLDMRTSGAVIRLRLADSGTLRAPLAAAAFDATFAKRKDEADAFYARVTLP